MTDPQLQKAADLYRQGKREEALQIVDAFLKKSPHAPDAWWLRSRLMLKPESKIYCLEQILLTRPGDERVLAEIENVRQSIPTTRQCPFCAETIHIDAIVCKHCGRDLLNPAPMNQPAIQALPIREIKKANNSASALGALVLLIGCAVVAVLCSQSNKNTASQKPTEMDACYMAQQFVQENLRAPSTAKFPSCYDVSVTTLSATQYSISSYVDSENGFGAMLRTGYTAKVEYVGDDKWNLIDLQFDE